MFSHGWGCAYFFDNMNQTMNTILNFWSTNQKTKTFIDLKPVKPPKDSTLLYIDEISPHLIHDVKTKGYVVMSVNVFPSYVSANRKRPNQSIQYFFRFVNIIPDRATFSFQTPATFHCSPFQSIHSFSDYFLWWEKVNYCSFRYVNGSAGFFISTSFFLDFIKIYRYFPMPLAFIPFSRGIQLQSLYTSVHGSGSNR